MKSYKSILFIVILSLFVGGLHFFIGPGYHGPFRDFVRGYLMDILLPMNLFLLIQISSRKKLSVAASRIWAAVLVMGFGSFVEIAQYNGFALFGSTFDPMDILMYALGVALALMLDRFLLDRWEQN